MGAGKSSDSGQRKRIVIFIKEQSTRVVIDIIMKGDSSLEFPEYFIKCKNGRTDLIYLQLSKISIRLLL